MDSERIAFVARILREYNRGQITQEQARSLLGISPPQERGTAMRTEPPVAIGTYHCHRCGHMVTALRDQAAQWTHCGECKYTLTPNGRPLNGREQSKLLAFKLLREALDGHLPLAHRTDQQMGRA